MSSHFPASSIVLRAVSTARRMRSGMVLFEEPGAGQIVWTRSICVGSLAASKVTNQDS